MEQNLIYLVGFFILLVIGLIITIMRLDKRVSNLLKGKDAKSLEDTLIQIINEINRMNTAQEKTEKIIKNINQRLATSITGIGVVRFNPFANSGGNQSFAIALLNEHGDGVVMSTLYSRDKTSVYAKAIAKYKSEIDLIYKE